MTIDKNVQQTVTGLLCWSHQKLNEFINECGIAYLVEIAPKYPQVTDQIARSEIFWNWWKGHWELRDQEFIETCDESPEAIIDVEQLYKDIHDPAVLAKGMYLNGQVLQQSYAAVIGQITKQQTA